jgi:hypothetical protein
MTACAPIGGAGEMRVPSGPRDTSFGIGALTRKGWIVA